MTAKEHYDTHLGNVYSWMLGDFFHKMSGQIEFFRKQGILPRGNHLAFDLGAGNGIQSVALAKIGFRVKAVDFNKQLLKELNENKQDLDIETFEEDILRFLMTTHEKAELIVCMGDTLTHFMNLDELEKIVERIAALLSENGKVVFSFRDLSVERKGTSRFFHLRSDDNRSMTCFLEYFSDHVMVYDLIAEKNDGVWHQKVSCYPKLRIPVTTLKNTLEKNGVLVLWKEEIHGMTFMTGKKIRRT